MTQETHDMTTTIDRQGIVPVPVPTACRSIQDQIAGTERLLAKLEMTLAKAPPAKRPAIEARIREADDRRTRLRRELQECIDINAPSVPPTPPTPDPLPKITVPKADIDREVYVAIATASDAETDVLAGILDRVVAARPNLSAAKLTQAVQTVAAAIAASRPDPAKDLSPHEAFRMSRILAAVVPRLSNPELRRAATEYTRSFLGSFRVGTSQQRQIQPLDLQFDRLAGVQQLRRDVWQRLYDAAADRPAVATAIDTGPLGEAVGVATTDGAKDAVAKVQMPTLRTLVNNHVKPNGTLVMPSGSLEELLRQFATDAGDLRESYTVNFVNINISIGKAEEKPDGDKSALEEAIAEAEKVQKELDEKLKKVGGGIKSTFGVMAAIADFADLEFGGDLREFATISVGILDAVRAASDAGIQVGKAIAGIASASANELFKWGGAGFALVMVTLMIQVSGLFGKSRAKPINEVILEEVRKLQEMITELREDMRARFDQIDRRLDKMYADIVIKLAEIDFDLGQVSGNVEELQTALYDLHATLVRLTADLHAQLEAGHRRDFVNAVNGFLNFADRTGEPIDAETFREAENVFYSWAHDHAKDPLQAGDEQRSFTDDALADELIRASAATNVNYLRLLPAERFGMPALGPGRFANPLDWIVGAEAYAQLSEESPALAGQISDSRVEDLIDVGEALADGLSRIAEPTLFAALAEHYRSILDQLVDAIGAFEREFEADDSDTRLHRIDPWGGADQQPASHFFTTSFGELRRCGGGSFDEDNRTLSTSVLGDLDRSQLHPYLIADNLSRSQLSGVSDGLSQLSACVSATWRTISTEDTGLGGRLRIHYELTITVNIDYGDDTVYRYRADTPERFITLVPKSEMDSFDPETDGKNPYPLLVSGPKLWSKLPSFPRSQGIVNPALRAATVATVEARLRRVQRAFYAGVASKLAQADDPIGELALRLTGSALLWRAMVLSGLPLSLQANEILRSLLFGGNAILAGTDRDAEDNLLDDLRDVYTLFATRDDEPPPQNVTGEVVELANSRIDRLSELLSGILESGNPPEPPQVFSPTLLRLSLLTV
jgi:hypothetical protein